MKSFLLLVGLTLSAAAQDLRINTPVPGAQLAFLFSVDTHPASAIHVAEFGGQTSRFLTWGRVNATVGTQLLLWIKDSTGATRSSAPFPVISGGGDSCIIKSDGSKPGNSDSSSDVRATPGGGPTTANQLFPSALDWVTPTAEPLAVVVKLHPGWPLGRGVVCYLGILLGAFGLFLHWTRCGRNQSGTGPGGMEDKEKEPSLEASLRNELAREKSVQSVFNQE
ncbi:hypothetical protein DFH08DRAFT_798476 [Mycena albidolilacea]|uniref:Uncharacterized protein n=1 Tax=Mycena albidolilacea TaxID=1033008 RepID=A0AAD7ANL9_9AGAR|nr:hypothetical protein DFH08DRAFT_798476 [Mycena albidolilacea]